MSGAKRWIKENEKIAAGLILAATLAFLSIAVFIPFSQSSLQSPDFPGHIQAAAYVRDVLWPNPIGWDHRFFGGNPLNQFYGPLSTWIAALLGFVLPLEIVFKLLLIIAGIATPLTVYYAARKYSFTPVPSAVIAFIVTALMYAFIGDWLGTEFYSTFFVGFFGNGLAAPLLFLFIGKLKQDYEKGTCISSVLLLAAISLMHIFVGLAAWLFLASFMAVSGREKIVYFLKLGALSFLLISFWAIPFALKFAYASPDTGAVRFVTLGLQSIALIGIALLSIAYITHKKDKELYSLFSYFALMTVIFLIGTILQSSVHFYRFLIIIFSISFFFPVRAIVLSKRPLLLLAPVIIGILVLAASFGAVDYSGPEAIEIPDFGPVDGRVMSTYYGDWQWHAISQLVAAQTGNFVTRGGYAESSVSSVYFRLAEREVRGGRQKTMIREKLELLGINWIIGNGTNGINFTESRYLTTHLGREIHLYRIGNTTLAQVLDYTPETISPENWKDESVKSFEEGNFNRISVATDSSLPLFVGTGKESVIIEEVTHERIRLAVDSDEPVPVYMKFSYYPNWKAYVNGEPAELYQAFPSFMLVYGFGEIELRYEPLPVDILGWLLTLAGILLLFLLWKKRLF